MPLTILAQVQCNTFAKHQISWRHVRREGYLTTLWKILWHIVEHHPSFMFADKSDIADGSLWSVITSINQLPCCQGFIMDYSYHWWKMNIFCRGSAVNQNGLESSWCQHRSSFQSESYDLQSELKHTKETKCQRYKAKALKWTKYGPKSKYMHTYNEGPIVLLLSLSSSCEKPSDTITICISHKKNSFLLRIPFVILPLQMCIRKPRKVL